MCHRLSGLSTYTGSKAYDREMSTPRTLSIGHGTFTFTLPTTAGEIETYAFCRIIEKQRWLCWLCSDGDSTLTLLEGKMERKKRKTCSQSTFTRGAV